MDNPKSAEIVKEALFKVLTGEDMSQNILHALRQHGLIKKRADAKKRVGVEAWLEDPTTDFELTAKGLSRLQGD
jgi:uncharacterized protein YjhX (UPF0386 family)